MSGLEEEAKQWESPGDNKTSKQPAAAHEVSQETAALSERDQNQALVGSLIGRAEKKLSTKLDPDVQREFSRFLALLIRMKSDKIAENYTYFELAFDQLSSDFPNLTLVRTIREELASVHDRSSYGLLRIVSYISGTSRLNAAMSALASVVLLSILFIYVMISAHHALVSSEQRTSALLATLDDGSIQLLTMTVHAAFIGGVVSITARIQDFVEQGNFRPTLVFVSVFRKPFLAAAISVLVFAALKAGLVSFVGVSFDDPNAPYLAWALGFLCGFSERFAQDYVASIERKFG